MYEINLFAWYISVNKIKRIRTKSEGPLQISIKCHKFPEKISPDPGFKIKKRSLIKMCVPILSTLVVDVENAF